MLLDYEEILVGINWHNILSVNDYKYAARIKPINCSTFDTSE